MKTKHDFFLILKTYAKKKIRIKNIIKSRIDKIKRICFQSISKFCLMKNKIFENEKLARKHFFQKRSMSIFKVFKIMTKKMNEKLQKGIDFISFENLKVLKK